MNLKTMKLLELQIQPTAKKWVKRGFRSLLTLLLIIFTLDSCSFISQENMAAHQIVGDFITAMDSGNGQAAWGILSQEAQQKVDHTAFLATNGEYQALFGVFERAGITAMPRSRKDVLDYQVKNLTGQVSIARFTTIEENGRWHIANVSPQPK